MSNFDPDNNLFHRVLWILFVFVGVPLLICGAGALLARGIF